MNSLDILASSPHYCCNKCMGIRNENLYFGTVDYRARLQVCGLAVAGMRLDLPFVYVCFTSCSG